VLSSEIPFLTQGKKGGGKRDLREEKRKNPFPFSNYLPSEKKGRGRDLPPPERGKGP